MVLGGGGTKCESRVCKEIAEIKKLENYEVKCVLVKKGHDSF